MKDIEGRLRSYMDAPWAKAPKAYQNIVHEDENVIVFKDEFPVTEGHLLFVPKKIERQLDITRCFELAYKWGVKGVCEYKWVAFNVGINNGVEAGQTVMWPHVHMIPRRKGDTPKPKGGVRNVIPLKGNYEDTTEGEKDFDYSAIQYHGKTKNYKKQQPEDDWENEGGVSLPHVDDNTPREELDAWTVKYHRKITRLKTAAKEDNWKERYEGYREWKKKIPMKELARLEEGYNET